MRYHSRSIRSFPWFISCIICTILALSRTAQAGGSIGSAADLRNVSPASFHQDTAADTIFDDSEFIYIPPPEPMPADPRFYTDRFLFVADGTSDEIGITMGKLVPVNSSYQILHRRDKSGSTPIAAQAASPTPVPTATPLPTRTPTPRPTPTLSAPTSIPTGPQADVADADHILASPPQHQLFPAEAKSEPDTILINGEYIQVSPPDADIEDPRFYRGSFKFDPSALNLLSATATTSSQPANQESSNANDVSALNQNAVQAAVRSYNGTSFQTLSPSYYDHTPLPISGKAMYSNPGIMELVLNYRAEMGEIGTCHECIGYAALLRAGDINRKIWIHWPDGTVEGPFLVIDVAATHHISLLLQRGWAVDVDYNTAMRHGMNRPLPVTVYGQRP